MRVSERTQGIKGGVYVLTHPKSYMKRIEAGLREQMPYEPTKKQIRWCFWDFLKFRFKYNGSLEVDYFHSQIFRKSELIRKDSMAVALRHPWRKNLIDERFFVGSVFGDKRKFNEAFEKYIHRKYLPIYKGTSEEEIKNFVHECNNDVFLKDPFGSCGQGVKHYVIDSDEKMNLLLQACKKSALLEEKIEQCEEISSFADSLVNTFRFLTLIDKNQKPHIAYTLIRMSNGKEYVDNFNSGGLVANIDINSGIISSPGRDRAGNSYVCHPVSGKQIIGYQIENWDEYKEFALELASQYPTVRYMGWDIIKNQKGEICVIEGNIYAAVDIIELGVNFGIRPYFESILNDENTFDYSKIL